MKNQSKHKEMENRNFTTSLLVDQSPEEVFNAINNVRGWWSEQIEGPTAQLNDEFTYQYQDVHNCRMKLTEVIPDKKVVWDVLDNYFSFTQDKREWKDTKISFEISKRGKQTQLNFTHLGLVPEYECYNACVDGWTQYIQSSLLNLITTGKGQPNTNKKAFTTHEVAARYSQLARQEKWFEIQDELFSENVKSIEPAHSPWLKSAEGKAAVLKKGEEWVKRIEAVHRRHTTEPVVAGNHFAVGREVDITVQGIGRIQINQVMMYEVKHGQITSQQFFY
jgi:hypothetical protein